MAKRYLLRGLGETVCDFTGDPIKVSASIEMCPKCGFRREEANVWTFADVLMNILAKAECSGDKDDFVRYQLGMDIAKYRGDILPLQEHPYQLLKQCVEDFKGFTIQIMVPLRRCLDDADEVEEEAEACQDQ